MIPPRSANVSLNEVAVLNCTAIATFIDWEVNGQAVDKSTRSKGFDDSTPLVTLNKQQNLRMRALGVTGSSDSNTTNIKCVAIHNVPVKSEPALILVQGIFLLCVTVNQWVVLTVCLLLQ